MLVTTKGAEMKKGIVLTITAILALFTTSIMACSIDTSTPEGTMLAYLEAYGGENADAMVNLEAEGVAGHSREERRQYYTGVFGGSENHISNLQITPIYQSETSATFEVVFVLDGGINSSPDGMSVTLYGTMEYSRLFSLTKTDGKWLVTSQWNWVQSYLIPLTVNAFMNAWASNDRTSMASYQTDDYSWRMDPATKTYLEERITSGEISGINDLKIRILEQYEMPENTGWLFHKADKGSPDDETSDVVRASYYLSHKDPDGRVDPRGAQMSSWFYLTRIDGKWLIFLRQDQ